MRKLENYTPTRFMAADSTYNKQMADYAVNFIECLCHTKGTWAGKPFELIDWQEQIIRDIFGTLKPNGYRQFNTAYVEIPKKMGKSELAAAVALLLTCGDGEERAEVYGCAADRQQATIVFDVAADMVRMCHALNRRVKILASQKRIVYQPTNSFYQVLSAEAYSKHGFNIHGVVFDELHTQPNRKLFDVMTKGSGDARMQPLYFLITTAGTDTNSICYETHQKAKDILKNGGSVLTTEYFDRLLEQIREIRLSERRFYQKITDIYATALDYDRTAKTTKQFFAKVQNKMHYAVHGHTAAELIYERADADKPHMGLTTWATAPEGKIVKSDVSVAKNYLSEQEMRSLERIVSAYLDLAEDRAERHIPMTMEDWAKRLDLFLMADDREVLQDAGKITAEIAKAKAETEFEKYRVIQDRLFMSDFDKYMLELEENAKK